MTIRVGPLVPKSSPEDTHLRSLTDRGGFTVLAVAVVLVDSARADIFVPGRSLRTIGYGYTGSLLRLLRVKLRVIVIVGIRLYI